MSIEYPEQVGWFFDVIEISTNIFKVTGKDKQNHIIELTGTEPEELLEKCKKYATDNIISAGVVGVHQVEGEELYPKILKILEANNCDYCKDFLNVIKTLPPKDVFLWLDEKRRNNHLPKELDEIMADFFGLIY